jgi:hypothetical protein
VNLVLVRELAVRVLNLADNGYQAKLNQLPERTVDRHAPQHGKFSQPGEGRVTSAILVAGMLTQHPQHHLLGGVYAPNDIGAGICETISHAV